MSEPKSLLISNLIRTADRFCVASGQSKATVAKTVFGRGGHFDDLEQGRRDMATGTYEKAMQWLSDHWPLHAPWPQDVARPEPLHEAAE